MLSFTTIQQESVRRLDTGTKSQRNTPSSIDVNLPVIQQKQHEYAKLANNYAVNHPITAMQALSEGSNAVSRFSAMQQLERSRPVAAEPNVVQQKAASASPKETATLGNGEVIQRMVKAEIVGGAAEPMDMSNDQSLAVFNGDDHSAEGFYASVGTAANVVTAATNAVPPTRRITWQQGRQVNMRLVVRRRQVGVDIPMREITAQQTGNLAARCDLPRDCGGTARELMGTDGGNTALGNTKDWSVPFGANPIIARTPFDAKRRIMEHHFGAGVLNQHGYTAAAVAYDALNVGDPGFDAAQTALDTLLMAPYNALTAPNKLVVDQQYGLNNFSVALPGEGRVITRDGHYGPGDDYPFHWSATIAESGDRADYVTLENYFNWEVHGNQRNRLWVHKMYGSARGESFHDQMVAAAGLGTSPITMSVYNEGSYLDGMLDNSLSNPAGNQNPTYLKGFNQYGDGMARGRSGQVNNHTDQHAFTTAYDQYIAGLNQAAATPPVNAHGNQQAHTLGFNDYDAGLTAAQANAPNAHPLHHAYNTAFVNYTQGLADATAGMANAMPLDRAYNTGFGAFVARVAAVLPPPVLPLPPVPALPGRGVKRPHP